MSNLLERQRKLYQEGRIRIGEKVPTKADPKKTRPGKRSTFRLTSPNLAMLEMAKSVYGGEIKPFEGRPGVKEYALDTTRTDFKCMISTESSVDQKYCIWDQQRGGFTRVCDGYECELVRFSGPELNAKASREIVDCLCDPDNRECRTKTSLRVLLTEIPATGLWRLDSHGEIFADELATALEMWEDIGLGGGGRTPIFCTLSMHQVQVAKAGEERKDFVVPRLSLDPNPQNFAQLIHNAQAGALVAPAAALGGPAAALGAPGAHTTQGGAPLAIEDWKALGRTLGLNPENWDEVKQMIRGKIQLADLVRSAHAAGVKGFVAMLTHVRKELAAASGEKAAE